MLRHNISNFLNYCKNSNFSKRSIETLQFRLNEFNAFIQQQAIPAIDQINYQHLLQFVADFGAPSPAIKKARVWSLHQFFHYLKLQQLIPHNIADPLPYPKIEKKIAQFLTDVEFKRILLYFFQHATDMLGLRTAAIVAINIRDVDLVESRLWFHEKGCWGQTKKVIPLPQVLCLMLARYIDLVDKKQEPLFISKRNQRYSPRSLQTLFTNVAGLQITQCLLGHQRMANTDHYAHLNPDIYAVHIKNIPTCHLTYKKGARFDRINRTISKTTPGRGALQKRYRRYLYRLPVSVCSVYERE